MVVVVWYGRSMTLHYDYLNVLQNHTLLPTVLTVSIRFLVTTAQMRELSIIGFNVKVFTDGIYTSHNTIQSFRTSAASNTSWIRNKIQEEQVTSWGSIDRKCTYTSNTPRSQ